jgi:hypothetical protein
LFYKNDIGIYALRACFHLLVTWQKMNVRIAGTKKPENYQAFIGQIMGA